MRRRALLVPLLAMVVLAPPATAAEGDCTLTLEPSTVYVWGTYVMHGEGFAGSGTTYFSWWGGDMEGNGADYRVSPWSSDIEMVAWPTLIGTGEISLGDDTCTATAILTVLPLPATDTVPTTEAPPATSREVAVLLLSFAVGLGVTFRRSRRAS